MGSTKSRLANALDCLDDWEQSMDRLVKNYNKDKNEIQKQITCWEKEVAFYKKLQADGDTS